MSKTLTANVSNQASRRIFLKSGLGACAAGAIIGPVSSQVPAVAYHKAIFDERFEAPCAFAEGAKQRRIPTVSIRGDITSLFFQDLDLRWKQGPVQLAGFTTPASLFCLDLLARDRGMRLSHYVTNPDVESSLAVLDGALPRRRTATHVLAGDPSPLVFWILAPSARARQNL